jgi:hypothetical protein
MNDVLFERLLFEEESTTLDFKRDQYRFVKATDEDKSELLKDILGFANAWRRSEAYILIGVEDVRGGRGKVVGIPATDHLDDHAIQQFVNNLTNRPVRFHYEAFGFEGKRAGIIRIEEQPRPLYLKKDYGKLKQNEVYVRRGSSTDRTKPASLDEIALMGSGSGQQSAELVVEFASIERDDFLGTHNSWAAEYCKMPPLDSIPDFTSNRQRLTTNLWALKFDPMYRINEDFFRELANYVFATRLFRPVRLVVKNVGKVAARSVRAELTIPTNAGVMIKDSLDHPEPPKYRADPYNSAAVKNIRPAFRRSPGEVDIDENNDRFRIAIDCGDLQPGRPLWSEVFYLGNLASGDLSLAGQVFAENLPEPKDFALTVSVNILVTHFTVSDLQALASKAD